MVKHNEIDKQISRLGHVDSAGELAALVSYDYDELIVVLGFLVAV